MQSITTRTRPSSPVLALHNHPIYYFPGGDLFIRITSTLFRIHSYFLTRELRHWRNFLATTTLEEPLLNLSFYPISTNSPASLV